LARSTLTALKSHNSRKLTEFYITQIYLKKNVNNISFIQLVKDRNIDFFLQDDKLEQGQEMAKSLNLGKNNDEALLFIENLKNNWHELTQDEKEIIWTYFDVLNLLSEKYLTQQYLKEKSTEI